MNNFIIRTLSGIVFVILIVGSIFLSPFVFMGLMFFVNILGVLEISKLTSHTQSRFRSSIFNVISCTLLFLLMVLAGLDIISQLWLLAAFLLIYIPFFIALYQPKYLIQSHHASFWISILYVSLPSGLLLYFYNQNILGSIAGPYLLLLLLVLIWINDIFAYLTGIWLGKKRLFERISPKKSWEGAIGGLLMTLLVSWLIFRFTDFMPIWRLAGMAVIVVVAAVYGDLIESMLKRQAGVKDSGTLIPGHGGVLDRFDATFFATPFVFVYLILTSGL